MPIRRLPTELIAEILTAYSATSPNAPLIFGEVCRFFRATALSTPAAWTRLRLSIEEASRATRKCLVWQSHAGACPLELHVDIPLGDGHDVVQGLNACGLQLHTLSLRAESQASIHAFLSLVDAPRIHTLVIEVTGDEPHHAEWLTDSEAFTLPFLPKLRHLYLTNCFLSAAAIPEPTLDVLQSLAIHRPLRSPPIPFRHLQHILRHTSALTTLNIHSRLTLPQQDTAGEQLQLAALRHISLRANNVPGVLNQLWTPSMSEIRLNELHSRRPSYLRELGISLRCALEHVKPAIRASLILEVHGVEIPKPDMENQDIQDWVWCVQQIGNVHLPKVNGLSEGRLSWWVPNWWGWGSRS